MTRPATLIALVLTLVWAARGPAAEPYDGLRAFDGQDRKAVNAVRLEIQTAGTDAAKLAAVETSLLAVLADATTTPLAKMEVARFLAVVGSAASVPPLAALLTDDKLADVARYGLAANPDPAAGKALRDALTTAQGRARDGLIAALGARRDAAAVPLLKPLATSGNALAVQALGAVGTADAIAVLRGLDIKTRPVGEALIAGARRISAGDGQLAAAVYGQLNVDGVPASVRVAALRGLDSLNAPGALDAAVAALQADQRAVQAGAARLAATLRAPATVSRFIAAFPPLTPATQAVVLTALADRGDAAALPLVIETIQKATGELRQVALRAVVRLADAQAVPVLLGLALKGDKGEKALAREALGRMKGAAVDAAVLELAKQGPLDQRLEALGVIADRKMRSALPLLFELARGKDAKLAMEACKSLGKLASASDHEQLVALLLGAGDDDLREAAAAALVAAAKRIGDPAKSLAPLLAAWDKASTELKVTLLAIYAAVGGEQALAQLATCTTATQPEVKRAAIEALADDSDDARALPALLAVVRAEPDKSLNVRAMRGYLRILRQDEGLRPPVKVQHLVAGLAATKRLDDQKQCLQLLRECRVNEAVDAVAAALDQADLRIEAANAILYLASDQKKGNKQLRAVKGAATKKALQKIIDVVEDATLKAQAQKLL